ncbi:helix-turn-helix domain-containing protein [Mammaliicoccus sciuri]|uniref:helix-turn-helix domain-containing protein n=1 Tax=Mammaliicoccus sciuri TaxID=1296 RepID=UPI00194F919B|nr:helix-turn-helix transcriptional regulator [Mammaliicoccus sciuri]MBV5103397.1 helix-turn-helix domain-containing protein [Mammaliicoccus sciuri]MDT0710203.1 helix-turn-helix transcriptional regulator [Mammaliicoccus sciuri]
MPNKDLANKLRYFRKAKKLTQKDVADHLNITPQAYQRYESQTNTNEPNLENLKKLSVIFDINLGELINEKENTNSIEDAEVLMFSDKEGWDELSDDRKKEIMRELSDLADFYIEKDKKAKGDQ